MHRIFYGWIIVATLFVVNFATQAAGMFNLGLFMIPMCKDLGISRSAFGWLTTSRSLAGGISSVFIGRIVDRFGPRIPVACSALITGLCTLGIGSSDQIKYLFLFFTLVGLAGLVSPTGGVYAAVPAAKWFIRRRGTAMGLATLGMGVGAIAFLPVTQILIEGFGWRTAWHDLAIISMTMSIPSALIFLRRQPEDMGLRPDGDSETEVVLDSSRPVTMEETVWTVREAIRTRTFWLLNAAWVATGFWQGANQHRIPYWIELGIEGRVVSFAFAVDAGAAAVMIVAAGVLLDRFPARFMAASAFIGMIVGTSLMLFASNAYHLFASAVITGLSVGVYVVCQTYLWANYYGRTFLGAIRGITLPAVLFANAVGAPAVGYIYDVSGGYASAWKLLIGICSIALLCMLAAKPPSGKPSKSN